MSRMSYSDLESENKKLATTNTKLQKDLEKANEQVEQLREEDEVVLVDAPDEHVEVGWGESCHRASSLRHHPSGQLGAELLEEPAEERQKPGRRLPTRQAFEARLGGGQLRAGEVGAPVRGR